MTLPEYWPVWGIGWLLLPRMTIGLLILAFFPSHSILGLTLAILGAVMDLI